MNLIKIISALLLSLTLQVFSLNVCAQEAPGDMQFEREGGDPQELINYPPSIFQHWVHRMRYRCDACHNHMFEMKAGSSTINHDSMDENRFCSSCHDGVTAFDAGFKNCNRCHVTEEK